MVWHLNLNLLKTLKVKKFKKLFLNLKIKIFVKLEIYCQRLGFNEILLCLHIMPSKNVIFFTFTQSFMAIRVLSHQSALKLIWCLLESNKTS